MKGDFAGHRFNIHTDTCVRCGTSRNRLVELGRPICPFEVIVEDWRRKADEAAIRQVSQLRP